MTRSHPSLLFASAAGLVLLAVAAPQAFAQQRQPDVYQPAVPATDPSELSGNRGVDRRLDRDEQTLRDLRQIVLQAKASGRPVAITDTPDPAMVELQAKVDDLQTTIGRLNGQMESLGHDLDLARKSAADANAANHDLAARLDALQAQLQTAPPAPGSPGQTGVLGQLPANAVPPPAGAPDTGAEPGGADEILAYRQARQVLDGGDYAGGSAALQDYLARYPTSPRAPEANYWLGRTLALRDMPQDAAAAYARSLKGWPQSPWAPDAVVRLSTALVQMKRTDDACRALTEFDTRYAAKATPALKTRARDARNQAACG